MGCHIFIMRQCTAVNSARSSGLNEKFKHYLNIRLNIKILLGHKRPNFY